MARRDPAPSPTSFPLGRTGLSDLVTLVGAAGITVALSFLLWQGIEETTAHTDEIAHALHLARGISTSLITATVIGLISWSQARRRARALEDAVEERTRDLDEARALMQLIVDTTPAGLILLGENREVVQANRAAQAVHAGPLVGRTCVEVLRPGCADCDHCAFEFPPGDPARVARLQSTDPRTGEVVEIEGHPLVRADGRRYTLLVERILTEQKKLQARLMHQEKMAAFGLLAAGIAHDLGNPLHGITLQLQLLEGEPLSPDTSRVVDTVRGEVERLQRLLRELVDFARRRRDEAALVSIQRVVEDALTLVRHDRRARNIRVAVDADPETPPVFMVEDHLVQVVLNLVLNAVDAMPDGGDLRVEIRGAEGDVALRVHDTGHGMDRATLARAFEPLFTTKEPGKGTGLGLSVCRDIVEAAGGRIELHSVRGQGTTAVVTLPAAAAEERNAAAPAPARRMESAA